MTDVWVPESERIGVDATESHADRIKRMLAEQSAANSATPTQRTRIDTGASGHIQRYRASVRRVSSTDENTPQIRRRTSTSAAELANSRRGDSASPNSRPVSSSVKSVPEKSETPIHAVTAKKEIVPQSTDKVSSPVQKVAAEEDLNSSAESTASKFGGFMKRSSFKKKSSSGQSSISPTSLEPSRNTRNQASANVNRSRSATIATPASRAVAKAERFGRNRKETPAEQAAPAEQLFEADTRAEALASKFGALRRSTGMKSASPVKSADSAPTSPAKSISPTKINMDLTGTASKRLESFRNLQSPTKSVSIRRRSISGGESETAVTAAASEPAISTVSPTRASGLAKRSVTTPVPSTPQSRNQASPTNPMRNRSMTAGWQPKQGDICQVCGKQVYFSEKLTADGKVWHKSCFRCVECNKMLSTGTYAALEGKLYCKPCFKKLFKLKGNYAQGFGKEQHKMKWLRSDGSDQMGEADA